MFSKPPQTTCVMVSALRKRARENGIKRTHRWASMNRRGAIESTSLSLVRAAPRAAPFSLSRHGHSGVLSASQRAARVATHPDAIVAACPLEFTCGPSMRRSSSRCRRHPPQGAAEGQVQAHLCKRRNFRWEDLTSFIVTVHATTAVVASLPWQSF
jgi:hypothetical protein